MRNTFVLNESALSSHYRLAPVNLRNNRSARYQGDAICAKLSDFVPADQAMIHQLYAFLLDWLHLLQTLPVNPAMRPAAVTFAQRPESDALIDACQQLGLATQAQGNVAPFVSRTLHDVRGGALTALLGGVQLLGLGVGEIHGRTDELDRLFILARDQLKLTRNAIEGLDDPARDHDRLHELHHIRTVLNKWENLIPGVATHHKAVHVDCEFDGNVSECCLESAALDRVLYNLIGNACRHTAADAVAMHIFLTAPPPDGNLRFVVSNPILRAHADALQALAGGHLNRLFVPEVSTTGSGLGLGIVAEFVAQAFGLRDSAEAVREGYVGAQVIEGEFVAWFHWPAVHLP